MIRKFKLTIYGRDEYKTHPLAIQCREAILKDMPYLTVTVKEEGKAPSRNWEKKS